MESGKRRRFTSGMLAACGAVLMMASAAWAGTEHVIHSFNGGSNGGYPDSDLVLDSTGNLYGTTVEGGTFDSGTVFMLSPSGGGWIETVLYSFTSAADGGEPYGGVTLDAQGNLYGTTVVGGTGGNCVESGCGVVFKLSHSGATWTESVIHNFAGGNDGYGPGAGVTFDRQGDLYGMTPTGGVYGVGVIYQLQPGSNGTWQETVIHTFTGGADGGTGSAGRLLLGATGNLFGVATVGGANGDGTAFELSPTAGGRWRFKTLYAFQGEPDAGYPYGALIPDASGNLYGTTYYDGANDFGSVYRLSPMNGVWTESVLYSFQGGTDGSGPISNLVFDAAGNLYGTTSEGGTPGCGCGTIFKLTPGSNGQWTESAAYLFQGHPDGGFPYNGMVAGPGGNFFGSTVHGGVDDEGSIYRFRP